MGKRKNIDIKPGKFKKKEENWCTSKQCQNWFIRAISLFFVLICIIITLWHCLGDVKRHRHEPVPVTNKILEIDILKWRFPNTKFDECCSTIEKKQDYLKNCNMIFNPENIECFEPYEGLYEGSIIVYLKSTRNDFEKGVLNALSGVKDIGGYPTKDHYKYEGIQIVKPKLFMKKKQHEVQFTPGTYIVTNVKGARSVFSSRFYPLHTKLKVIKIVNLYYSKEQVRGQIENPLDWVLIQDNKTEEIFMKRITSMPEHQQTNGTVYIPAHLVPHLEYLLEEGLENLITTRLIHQIKNNKGFVYSMNALGRMLTWQNHDAIDVENISTIYEEGTVVTWGDKECGGDFTVVQDELTNIRMIFSTDSAFAALTNDGNVVTWGHVENGGNSTLVQNQLKNIKMIFSTHYSFAALTTDGNVVTWGYHEWGSDADDVQNQLHNIKMISSNQFAFVALTTGGRGRQIYGGDSTAIQHQLKNIKIIFSTDSAFAALTNDGNVITWGSRDCGGDSINVQHRLQNIKIIFSSNCAFAALTTDGNVVTWGEEDEGGNSNDVQDQLKNIKMIFCTGTAFAALTTDGNVVTWGSYNSGGNSNSVQHQLHNWGDQDYDGDSNDVQDQLKNIKTIFSTGTAFAALTIDGNVVTWGNHNSGGNSNSVQHQLHNIKIIFSTVVAFAALKTNGNVVTWGAQDWGGDSISVQDQLKKIKMIFSTRTAFAALTTGGNVVTWGEEEEGGNSITVQNQLKNVKMVFSTDYAFAAFI